MAMQILLPLALLAAAPEPPGTAATGRDTTEVVKRAQTLFDGLAPGDVALWKDALTEDAVLIDLFRRDQRGRVTSLIERRKFNDLHMRRIEEP
jgi:hypothetical protein